MPQATNLTPAQRPTIRPHAINASVKPILPARGPVLPHSAVPSMYLNSAQTNLTASAHQFPSALALSSSPLNHQPMSDTHLSLGLDTASSPNSSPIFAPIDPASRFEKSLPQAPQSAQNNFPDAHNTSAIPSSCLNSSLPVASLEQSSSSSGQPPNTAQSIQGSNTQQTANAIHASITEVASVYDLPVSSLERLVGDIIREDGFVQLVYILYQSLFLLT